MTIQRARVQRRRRGFVQIDNVVVRDVRISLKARGMLAWLLSQPDDFTLDIDKWAEENREGEPASLGGRNHNADLRESRDAIKGGMRELKAAGYVKRFQQHCSDGTFEWCTFIREDLTEPWAFESVDNPPEPQTSPTSVVPNCENESNPQFRPQTAQPPTANASIYKKTNKEWNTEYADYGKAAQLKAHELARGHGCQPCDTTGMIERDDGNWQQCRSCGGSGIDAEPLAVAR